MDAGLVTVGNGLIADLVQVLGRERVRVRLERLLAA